jgi:hypothetical protein
MSGMGPGALAESPFDSDKRTISEPVGMSQKVHKSGLKADITNFDAMGTNEQTRTTQQAGAAT